MVLTLLPTTAFAALSDSLGNTPRENQAILEQLSALTGSSSSDQVLSMLNALGLLDEDGNFKVDQTITLDGQVLTLAAGHGAAGKSRHGSHPHSRRGWDSVALGDLKTMIQIEQELQRIKDTYFSGRGVYRGSSGESQQPDGAAGAAGHQLAVFRLCHSA